MRQKCISVYPVDELSAPAQSRAFEEWLSHGPYGWTEDNRATLDAFVKIFPVRVGTWEYGRGGAYITGTFTEDDVIGALTGVRLMKYLWNHYAPSLFRPKTFWTPGPRNKRRASRILTTDSCVLTGYCMDDDILAPVYAALRRPYAGTFADLMQECLNAWVHACDDDFTGSLTPEAFRERAQENGWEYDAYGRLVA